MTSLLASVVVACGTTVTASGAGGAASSSASSTIASSGGGSSSVATSSTGAGGDPTCATSQGGPLIQLTLPDGTFGDCRNMGAGPYDISGVVLATKGQNQISLDTCVPGSGCQPAVATLEATNGVAWQSPPVGSFARIRLGVHWFFDCTQAVVVNEIDSFGGVKDPNAQSRLWLVAVDGDEIFAADANGALPFTLTHTAIPQCKLPPGDSCGGQPFGPFRLDFQDRTDATIVANLYMGQSVTGFKSGGQTFYVANDQSASFGFCDVHTIWSWWATPSVP